MQHPFQQPGKRIVRIDVERKLIALLRGVEPLQEIGMDEAIDRQGERAM
jgi:hypothetical protein